MSYILTADFGSTYTKLTAIDTEKQEIIATSRAFTTISTDVGIGYRNALELLRKQTDVTFDKMVASSSAAGGLKMIAVGLVPSLTANAAKMAATSAGAKVIATFSYELSLAEAERIREANPDIILLCGGIDGGNKEVILRNAQVLSDIDLDFSIIAAGNKSARDEVEKILKASGKRVIACENVMPRFNELNIASAKAAIRDLFIERIIEAKGLSGIAKMASAEIIPTPLACFEACELLSDFGGVMAVDVGGATTDIYSMDEGLPTKANVLEKGLKEPFAKRTVEGDLGVRYNIPSVISEYGLSRMAENLGISESDITNWADTCRQSPDIVPEDNIQRSIDEELAGACVEIGMQRHCGSYEVAYTPVGEVNVQMGKDLTKIKYLIATGGSIINSPNAEKIVRRGVYRPEDLNSLKPVNPKIIIDRKNILTAMGLLSRLDSKLALAMMEKEYGL